MYIYICIYIYIYIYIDLICDFLCLLIFWIYLFIYLLICLYPYIFENVYIYISVHTSFAPSIRFALSTAGGCMLHFGRGALVEGTPSSQRTIAQSLQAVIQNDLFHSFYPQQPFLSRLEKYVPRSCRDLGAQRKLCLVYHLCKRWSHRGYQIFVRGWYSLKAHQSSNLLHINVHHLTICPSPPTL